MGVALAQAFLEEEVYAWGRRELDFTEPHETIRKICTIEPDVIIHSGAMTNVKGCELNPVQAYRVNGSGACNIALAARECDAKLVYISTDYVFDGKKGMPYLEFDPLNPLNVYGCSKQVGEEIVRALVPKSYIVRTSWLYSEQGCNFPKTMLRLAFERKRIRVVDDQWGTPTYVKDLAAAVKTMVSEPFYGTYHASNLGVCTWFDFAQQIFDQMGLTPELIPVSTEEYGDIVQRPSYSVLENFHLEELYGYTMRNWQEALSECLKHLKAMPEDNFTQNKA